MKRKRGRSKTAKFDPNTGEPIAPHRGKVVTRPGTATGIDTRNLGPVTTNRMSNPAYVRGHIDGFVDACALSTGLTFAQTWTKLGL